MFRKVEEKTINALKGNEVVFDSVSECVLTTTVAGNGQQGGDAGHGARARIKLENSSGFVFEEIKTTEDSIDFTVAGDAEVRCIIDSFRKIANELEIIALTLGKEKENG